MRDPSSAEVYWQNPSTAAKGSQSCGGPLVPYTACRTSTSPPVEVQYASFGPTAVGFAFVVCAMPLMPTPHRTSIIAIFSSVVRIQIPLILLICWPSDSRRKSTTKSAVFVGDSGCRQAKTSVQQGFQRMGMTTGHDAMRIGFGKREDTALFFAFPKVGSSCEIIVCL
jgi:hypothetical protein